VSAQVGVLPVRAAQTTGPFLESERLCGRRSLEGRRRDLYRHASLQVGDARIQIVEKSAVESAGVWRRAFLLSASASLLSASTKRNPTDADVIAASDQDRSVAFCTRHVGWRQDRDMDLGDLGSYRFLYKGETMIGAIMPRMPQVPQAASTFYIGVGDINRAADETRAGGGTILHGPSEIPGGEHSLTAVDPQGAIFGLVGPRK
jgi:predicted enzyme related to lactoylglutathione lyase